MKHYTKEEIYQALKSHEGVNIAYTDLDRERVLSNPLLQERLAGLRAEGERFLGHRTMEIPFSVFRRFETVGDGDRNEYEYAEYGYFIRRKKMTTYAILSWLYGREEDIRELEDVLWAICNEYTWCLPAHLQNTGLTTLQEDGYTIDLFSAECASGMAEILSLVGDKLSPIVKMRVERYLKERVIDIADREWHFNNGAMKSNWVSVCNGGAAICAIYQVKDIDRLTDILYVCINALEHFYDSFTEDGVCGEGMGYFTYGFGYFAYFADLLKRRTGGVIDLFDNEKLEKCVLFFGNGFFKKGEFLPFADMWGEKLFSALPGLASYLKKVYPNTKLPHPARLDYTYSDWYRARFTRDLREFVWVDPDILSTATEELGTYIYPNAEIYVSTANKTGISIAAKGGHNAEPHNHNDIGSFALYKNGVRMLDDIGCCTYTKDYFHGERYKYFNASSASHNVPIINEKLQVPGREHRASEVAITEDGIRMNIAGAYDDETLASLVRDIHFDRASGEVTLCDTYRFTEAPSEVAERFVSAYKPEIQDGKIILGARGEHMTLHYDSSILSVRESIGRDTYQDRPEERITYIVDLVYNGGACEFSLDFKITE